MNDTLNASRDLALAMALALDREEWRQLCSLHDRRNVGWSMVPRHTPFQRSIAAGTSLSVLCRPWDVEALYGQA